MKDNIEVFKRQYELVKQSRQVLFEYCSTISNADFLAETSSFGRGSIRNLLVHVANTYEFWIGRQGLKKNMPFTKYESREKIEDVVALFRETDALMAEFLNFLEIRKPEEIEVEINGNKKELTPTTLFSHVITHEFHHKGQILSLSRHLGYIPVDTDMIR